eukprot:758330-Hanusia_phi.AAC.7
MGNCNGGKQGLAGMLSGACTCSYLAVRQQQECRDCNSCTCGILWKGGGVQVQAGEPVREVDFALRQWSSAEEARVRMLNVLILHLRLQQCD